MTRFSPQVLFVFGTCAASVACGGSDGAGKNTTQTSEYTAAAIQPCKTSPNSTFLDDELCLEPPPADVGFQLYFGPGAGHYDDPNAVAPWVLNPGDEGVLCIAATTGNTDVAYSQEHHVRTRTGTHHIIYWRSVDPTQPTGVPADGTTAPSCRTFQNQAFFIGMESGLQPTGGKLDVPLPGDLAKYTPEERGTAMKIAGQSRIWIETHFVNTDPTKPLLREAWANVVYSDPTKVTQIMDPIFFIGGSAMAVPPLTTQVVGGGPVTRPATTQGDLRFMGLAGHAHAHTVRETAYVKSAGATDKHIVYQTFNWAEPLWAQFDEAHTNPPILDGKDGAISGPFILQPGDELSWECEVNNTLPNITLRFADRAYDAEMCNMFGYYTPGNGSHWPEFFP